MAARASSWRPSMPQAATVMSCVQWILGHVYFFCGLQSGFVVVFTEVIVEEDVVIPAGMVAIEVDGALQRALQPRSHSPENASMMAM